MVLSGNNNSSLRFPLILLGEEGCGSNKEGIVFLYF